MPRVAILGGGISGLAAALCLKDLAAKSATPVEIALYERSDVLGGCIRTIRENGLVLELGPDSLLVDKRAARQLLRRVGLEDQIVDMRADFKAARIVHAGRLRSIPADFRLFTPTSYAALLRSGIFTPLGIARAALEPFVPPRRSARDESLASFVTRRFGREVLDNLAQPLIGGIYSADPQRLSMQATLPQFTEMERRYGSLFRAMHAPNSKPEATRLASLRDGVGCIVDALCDELRSSIHTGACATRLRRANGSWAIDFASGSVGPADAVICAIPAYVAAALLREYDADFAQHLERIRYNSIATINLAYPAAAASALPRCTGFVVPYNERRLITAATFTTQKYPARAPERTTLVRAFVGGALQPELLGLSDERLVEIVEAELGQLAGLHAKATSSRVNRWERLLPEYAVGHVELVAQLERRAAQLGGIALAGSAYAGVGIPDCIHTGEAAAASAFGYIRR